VPTSNPYLPIAVPALGVQSAAHPRAIDPAGLRDAENVLFRDGVFSSRPGCAAFGLSVGERPLGFTQYDHALESKRLVMGTDRGWWRWDKAAKAWVKILDGGLPLTGTETSQVVFRVFQKDGIAWLLGVNGQDHPKCWDGDPSHPYQDIGGDPRHARCIAVADNHVILAGFTDGPQEIEYSNNGDFNAGWSSFSKRLGETEGPITAMAEAGSKAVIIGKSDGLYAGTRYTPEYPFTFDPLYLGVPGPVAPNAFVPLPGGGFYYLGWDAAVYAFDGASAPRSIGPDTQRHIADSWYFPNKAQAWAFYNHQTREFWVVFPFRGTGELSHGVVISLPAETMEPVRWETLRMSAGAALLTTSEATWASLPVPWATMTVTWASTGQEQIVVLLGSVPGTVYKEFGAVDNGAPIAGFWEYGLQSLDTAARWATVLSMEHYFGQTLASQLITIRFRVVKRGEAGVLTPAQTFDLRAAGPLRTGHRISGRMLAPRYEFSATEQITFEGAEVGVASRGLR
jgi:hypothetical protein